MTSPTGTSRDRAPAVLRRLVRRATTALTATTAGGVLLLGSPVLTASSGSSATPGTDTSDPSVRLVAAERHRWPGHPGRTLVRHRVRPGETVTGLAVRYHAWTAELRRINHLGRHARLYVGRRITIPVVVAAARRHHHKTRHHKARHARHHVKHHKAKHHKAHRARHHKTRHHKAHHRARHHRPWHGTHASRAQVRRLIVHTARRQHVNTTLALAIAWQESGWQQRRISSAGAVGAMQVMPGTGRWMSLYVGRRLNIYALRDNVVAGVVLLKVLRSQTTWRRTVGGYYQGLGSIRARGMYPSTRHYVRSVRAIYRSLKHGRRPA